MNQKLTGKCLCGEVTYIAYGRPNVVAQCHCEECRRSSGTGHSVGAMFRCDAVEVKGSLTRFVYRSSKNSDVTKAFCEKCGSPIYGTNTRSPDYLTLTLGSMDAAGRLDIEVVIFERDRPDWDQLKADVPSFSTQPDWKPDNGA